MRGYKTIAAPASAEHTEKRSRFFCLAAPIHDEEGANALLAQARTRYWDANHNCYAYILRGATTRCSDDGEPQGTAGLPILEVLRHRELEDVILIVTRYFGGTLLGAGGLVRAYSHSAALALDSASVLEMRPCAVFSLQLPYHHYGKVQNLLAGQGGTITNEEFSDIVALRGRIAKDSFSAFEKALAELSAGQCAPTILGEEYAHADS